VDAQRFVGAAGGAAYVVLVVAKMCVELFQQGQRRGVAGAKALLVKLGNHARLFLCGVGGRG